VKRLAHPSAEEGTKDFWDLLCPFSVRKETFVYANISTALRPFILRK